MKNRFIVVNIVGDQPAPSVLFIRYLEFKDVDKYIFITTELMEEKERLQCLVDTLQITPERYSKVIVPGDDLLNLNKALNELNLPSSSVFYLVNITSGSKVMSIGVFNYFSKYKYKLCSKVFYLPIKKNGVVQVFPEEEQKEEEITYCIPLHEYLSSYGIRIVTEKNDKHLHRPSTYTAAVLPLFLEAMDSGRSFVVMMKGLRDSYRQVQQKSIVKLAIPHELATFLQKIEYPLPDNNWLDKPAIEYLIGGWLEEWVYTCVKECLGLPDEAIRYGVRVARPNAGGDPVPNECDLLFTFNNTLYLVECKSGLGFKPKQLFEESVYKLTALRIEFGQRVEALFLTLSNLRDRKGRLKSVFLHRAQLHRVTLFDRKGVEKDLERYLKGLKDG